MALRLIYICCLLLLAGGCAERQRRNPLDWAARNPQDSHTPLAALAGDGEVRLRWDYSRFEDIDSLRLYRRVGEGNFALHPVSPLQPGKLGFTDTGLVNGVVHDYQLGLLVDGEGEVFLERVLGIVDRVSLGIGFSRAIPGEETAWVADFPANSVWKISPDGRSTQFRWVDFPAVADLALYRKDGSCWVSAAQVRGLFRLDVNEELQEFAADIERPAGLSIDSEDGVGWIIDAGRRTVYSFSPEQPGDPLELLEVDAHFSEPMSLAARDGRCWIVDRGEERVLLYGHNGGGRMEWRDVPRPLAIAAAPESRAWLLVRDGGGLLRLDGAGGATLEAALPFSGALALDVDRQSGACWVVSPTELAVFSAQGALLSHHVVSPDGGSLVLDIALDELHRRAWIATGEGLMKSTMAGEGLARLQGFAATRVEVDPGPVP